ncbi:MAG: ROK family protein [Bacteroidales bacterium]|nr:ROK family protein [Bacteroidales bacterium]
MNSLGVDIGASGIKAAPVDLITGKLISERIRIETPFPATPDAVVSVISKLVECFDWKGLVGCGFPGVIKNGVAKTAANLHKSWINVNALELISNSTNCIVKVINDADAAGVAEVKFGRGKNIKGLVLMVTVGTGLGTVLFNDGKLIPNTEFGHLFLKNEIAEHYASDAIRKKDKLSWTDWGKRFNDYLCHLENLLWPELIIIGGGASKKFEKYNDYLNTRTKVVPAQLLNYAGIIGAAVWSGNNQ